MARAEDGGDVVIDVESAISECFDSACDIDSGAVWQVVNLVACSGSPISTAITNIRISQGNVGIEVCATQNEVQLRTRK